MKRAAVLGAGAWGTALAKLLADGGDGAALFTIDEPSAALINQNRENRAFLPGVALSARLVATHEIERALDRATLVVLAVPSQALRPVLERARPYLPAD